MAASFHYFTKFTDAMAAGLVNLTSDSLYVMLLSAYTPAYNTHKFLSDVLGAGTEVANGLGYTTNGQVLAGESMTDASNVTTLTFTNPSWSGASFAAAFAVFYDRTPATNATRPVYAAWDFGGTQTGTGGNYVLSIAGTGFITFTGTG